MALSAESPFKVALLWRGDRQARRDARPAASRLSAIFEALARRGIEAEPAVYSEDMAGEVRDQLLRMDGVLVWVDPISGGERRDSLDALLREMSSAGVFVSAHRRDDFGPGGGLVDQPFQVRHMDGADRRYDPIDSVGLYGRLCFCGHVWFSLVASAKQPYRSRPKAVFGR